MDKLAVEINGKPEAYKREIQILAKTEAVKSMDWELIEQYISDRKDIYRGYEMFALADETGDYISTLGDTGNIADRDYFLKAMNDQIVITDPFISQQNNWYANNLKAKCRAKAIGILPCDNL